MSNGLFTLVANGSATGTITRPGGHSVTVPVTVATANPDYLPKTGDRVLIDTRSGGANDMQAVTITGTNSTDLAAAKAVWPDTLNDAGNGMARFINNSDLSAKVFCHDSYGFAHETLTQSVTAVATTASGAITGSGTAQSVAVVSSTGFTVGDTIHIDGPKALYPNQYTGTVGANGCPWEPVVITAIADGTHISGIFTLSHASGAVIAKQQTVTVSGSTLAQTTHTIGVGFGTGNQEAMFLASKTGTSLTGGFAKNHSSGDPVAYPSDMGVGKLFTYFPPNDSQSGVRPRHLFLQFKHHIGKTTSDSGGRGTVGVSSLYNGYSDFIENFDPSQSNSNAGRKFWLIEREIESQAGLDRLGMLWGGSNGLTQNPFFDTDASSYSGVTTFGSPSPTVDPTTYIGHTVTHTVEVLPESSRGASDGAFNEWVQIDGGSTTQITALTGLKLGPEAFDRMEILPTYNSIKLDVTEYTWDYIVWERPWVGTVPPSRPTAAPTFVSATSTTMTLSVHVPQNCDTLRFFSGGGNMGVQSTYYVGSQMGSDITVTSGDWGTTKSVTVTGLTGTTAYTGICVSAGLSGKFGTQSAGLATASTI